MAGEIQMLQDLLVTHVEKHIHQRQDSGDERKLLDPLSEPGLRDAGSSINLPRAAASCSKDWRGSCCRGPPCK